MKKCRRMKRPQCTSKNWIYSWLWKSSKTRQQSFRSESFAMKTDTLMSGSTVKNRISLKTGFGYSATRRTSFRSWFQAWHRVLPLVLILQPQWHLQDRRIIILHQRQMYQARFSFSACLKLKCWRDDRTGRPVVCWHPGVAARIQRKFGGWQSSWTQRLTRQFFSWSIFRAHPRDVRIWVNTVFILISPKDRNCEICHRTKITRAPCRRRTGGALLRAENFGDLIAADHIVLSDNCESRNNHRYAVVVQDLATQWIQSYPCKTKTSQGSQRSLQKFLEADRKP